MVQDRDILSMEDQHRMYNAVNYGSVSYSKSNEGQMNVISRSTEGQTKYYLHDILGVISDISFFIHFCINIFADW